MTVPDSSLWWVRRDMRLADNPAAASAAESRNHAAIMCWTPGVHFWSGRRVAHLARVAWQLREAMGGALSVRRGEPAQVVTEAARQADASVVWAAQEFSPSGVATQDAVRTALEADGRELRFVGSPYAVAPGRVRKSDGDPYKVFTPFRESWRAHGWRSPAPALDGHGWDRLSASDQDVDLDQMAAHGDTTDPLLAPHEFREERVLADFGSFVDDALDRYQSERDRPDLDSTSHLSTALAFGQIHPRTVLAAAARHDHPSARIFESELAWREFHADVLFHHPGARRESLTPVLSNQDWVAGTKADAAFMAWRDGLTGFPMVDAGMRQLAQTGWMHNRVRMVVASFLVKDLRVPWQRGADHFRRALVDYDHAQNQLNWQWVAGTGRDAAPFFRIFNPESQRDKFDPQRRYVERWIPELDTPGYPTPMLDHKAERAVTLEMYQRAKAQRSR
ncbi:DNA photolyase family protein [Demequina sp. B12]|uniref:cryptochrome/photolyase family protein n=1 Tax=Demequina sp. B12 TaxID=2992757 RepID=UPI00237BD967|nr:deoxyribodipyrimidine photo-lyase [Demequina sp. B12]MDE0572676.1 DNA photolyase family protein [Demequina sp. B12]